MLSKQQNAADSYAQWADAARRYDASLGLDDWKHKDQTGWYDYREIRTRLSRLRELMQSGDDHGLLFALNEGMHGNMAGMGQPRLYSKAKFGTKALIHDYIDELLIALDRVATSDCTDISLESKLEFLYRAKHCYGTSALMLSGAGTLGLFHMGVVKALAEQELLPRVISGSSAGAMIAAAVGTHSDEELKTFFSPENSVVISEKNQRMMDWMLLGARRGRLDRDYIDAMHSKMIRDMTFQEAYEHTGHALNIPVSPAGQNQRSRLLNAITSPNVTIRSAVMASSAVPGMLEPVTLEAVSASGRRVPYLASRQWLDGSISADLPAKRLSRLYGVNHFIVSQINPLVLWALTDPKTDFSLRAHLTRLNLSVAKSGFNAASKVFGQYIKRSPALLVGASQLHSVVNQSYTGDVNIFPSFRFFDPRRLARQLNIKDTAELIREGERATWPKIEMIRNSVRVGQKIDALLREMSSLKSRP